AGVIAFYRLFLAVIIMAPLVFFKYQKEIKNMSKRNWALAIVSGFFLAFHFIFWFESLNLTSVASSVTLVAMQPIFAFIGTYFFFGERFSVAAFISLFITIGGSIIISWGDFQVSGWAFLGDLLALLGAVFVTGYFLLGQQLRRNHTLIAYTLVVYGVCSVTLLINYVILNNNLVAYSGYHWSIFLALAIVPTFLGHTLFNWALKWVSTSTISMATVFEPIGASILAYIILQ